MEAAIDNDEFIEHARFAGNMYGTSKAAVKTVRDKGGTVPPVARFAIVALAEINE